MKVVITGSSTGIGRALATRLIAQGHHVWGLARSDQADFAAQHPRTFHSLRCDVSEWPQVALAAGEVAAAWQNVDALVTCAAVHGEIGRALAADPAQWRATVRTNLDGTFFALRAFDPLLARAFRRAKIVCFSGGGATQARPNFSAYGVAKTGVVRLVETIAAEERGRALDINAVAPGGIDTRLTDEIVALGPVVVGEGEHAAAQKQKFAGPGPRERALDLVEWLLSAESDGVTGRLLSAQWDNWSTLGQYTAALNASDVFTLRRILPADRGQKW